MASQLPFRPLRAAKKQNLLTKAKIQALDRIGFTWSIDPRESWEQRFEELESFKKKHGHCNVPKRYPQNRQLANWVGTLRSLKRRNTLDKRTIRRLDKLGFHWSPPHHRVHCRDLDEFVAFLTAFKKRHGHCDFLAARGCAGKDLVGWVQDVRKSKKQGRLDSQRIRQLDRLGFVWEPRKQGWQQFYAALLDYRKQYGDCRVPVKWPQNPWLGAFVHRMRTAKKRNLLTKAQVRELDQIGFIWSITPRYSWEQHVRDLETFKKKHKHCDVPKTYPPNPALGHWVSHMRQQKRLGTLAKDRVYRLAALGFNWTITRGGRGVPGLSSYLRRLRR
jgi:hypothetical protein